MLSLFIFCGVQEVGVSNQVKAGINNSNYNVNKKVLKIPKVTDSRLNYYKRGVNSGKPSMWIRLWGSEGKICQECDLRVHTSM